MVVGRIRYDSIRLYNIVPTLDVVGPPRDIRTSAVPAAGDECVAVSTGREPPENTLPNGVSGAKNGSPVTVIITTTTILYSRITYAHTIIYYIIVVLVAVISHAQATAAI